MRSRTDDRFTGRPWWSFTEAGQFPASGSDADIATCHPIRMEVLAGARDERHLDDLRGLLARASIVPTEPTDYEAAAALFRICRRGGETVRKLIDCLIAALAIRAGIPLLHADADFDVLARHTALRVERP